MNLSRLLIIVLIIDVLLSFSSDLLEVFDVSVHPSSLVALSDIEPRISEGMVRTAGCIYFAALFAAYIGLLKRWNPARFLYLLAWLISLALVLLGPAEAFTGLGAILHLLVGFSGGFLVCLVFCTPLAGNFHSPPGAYNALR